MCSGSIDDYNSAVADNQKRLNIIYKQKPAKINTLHCNAAILKLLRANMNIEFVTRVYAMLVYLTLYLCKPKHTMSRLMKKVAKEAQRGVQKQVFKKYFLRDEKLVHMTQLKELYQCFWESLCGRFHTFPLEMMKWSEYSNLKRDLIIWMNMKQTFLPRIY